MIRMAVSRVVFGVLLLASLDARAARQLPQVADDALTSAEQLLANKTGDERSFACIDALPFLKIVYATVPEYAYSTGLYAECLYLSEDWTRAEKMLEKYLSLVPLAVRHGAVEEKVETAEERLRVCRTKLGHPLGDSLPPAPVTRAPPPSTPTMALAPEAKAIAPEPPPSPPVAPAPKAKPPVRMSDDFVLPPEELAPQAPHPHRSPKPAAARARQLIVRAGYSPLAGVVGVSVEGKLGPLGLVIGSGAYPLAVGLSISSAAGRGGPYLDVHALWDGSSLFVTRESSRLGVGATVGWDFRPLPRLSLQAGLGGGYDPFIGPLITGDLTAGVVFGL